MTSYFAWGICFKHVSSFISLTELELFTDYFEFLTVQDGSSEVSVLNRFAVISIISPEASILMPRSSIFCVTLALHHECWASRPASSTVERKQHGTQQNDRTFHRIFLKPKFESRLLVSYICLDHLCLHVIFRFSDALEHNPYQAE